MTYEIFVSAIVLYSFSVTIYYRIKTINIRFKLKHEKVMIKGKEFVLESLLNVGFWIIPLFKYRNIGNLLHNKYLVRSNLFLLLFICSFMLIIFTHKILW